MIRSWLYVAFAIVTAALGAGSIVGAEFLAFVWIATLVEGGSMEGREVYGLLVTLFAAPAFLIGLVFPGVPIWLWLHGIGRRSYGWAALAGALGAGLAGTILTAAAGWSAFLSFAWLALPGAAAGLIVRWIAYRPKPPPAPIS